MLEGNPLRAVLLDVEGTTTPIDFVFKKLFPFAAEHGEEYLRDHWSDPELQALIAELRSTWSGEAAAGAPVWVESSQEEKLASVRDYLRWLIARDSKITPLKTLEGKIWEQGFRVGLLKGEVYPDVAPAFARWRAQGRQIAIFSSGSVLAQKLLFSHSTSGDLSCSIEAYFDTSTGGKRQERSYRTIATSLGLAPEDVLFISDVEAELDAARAARMRTAQSLRPGIAAPANPAHRVIRDFAEI